MKRLSPALIFIVTVVVMIVLAPHSPSHAQIVGNYNVPSPVSVNGSGAGNTVKMGDGALIDPMDWTNWSLLSFQGPALLRSETGMAVQPGAGSNLELSVGIASQAGSGGSLVLYADSVSMTLGPTATFASTNTSLGTSTSPWGPVWGSTVGMKKDTAGTAAPGANFAQFHVRCGTNAGTAKLTINAGTSSTEVTVLDNIGAGVTGC